MVNVVNGINTGKHAMAWRLPHVYSLLLTTVAHYYLLPLLTATHYYFSKDMSHFYPYLVEYASSFVKSEFLFGEIKRLSEKFVYHFLNMFENLSAKFR